MVNHMPAIKDEALGKNLSTTPFIPLLSCESKKEEALRGTG